MRCAASTVETTPDSFYCLHHRNMETGMFGFLLLSGLCHFASSLPPRQYVFINEPKTWPEAQRYCRERYTDLATVNDQQNLEELAGLTKSGVSNVFLGLHKSWGWSRSDTDDYKQGEPAYWNWAHGEPTEPHQCGSIGETGEWFSTNCYSNMNYICYNGSKTDVSERFTLVGRNVSWFAARTYCRQWYTDLARVRNQLENEELQRKLNGGLVWIGLMKMSWEWSDGSTPSFIPWRPLQPQFNEVCECATLYLRSTPLGMKNRPCTERWPFYCHSDYRVKRLVRLKLIAGDSSVDIADPAVVESIRKWVEKQLSAKGVTKDVKLRWKKLPETEKKTKDKQTKTVCVP